MWFSLSFQVLTTQNVKKKLYVLESFLQIHFIKLVKYSNPSSLLFELISSLAKSFLKYVPFQ